MVKLSSLNYSKCKEKNVKTGTYVGLLLNKQLTSCCFYFLKTDKLTKQTKTRTTKNSRNQKKQAAYTCLLTTSLILEKTKGRWDYIGTDSTIIICRENNAVSFLNEVLNSNNESYNNILNEDKDNEKTDRFNCNGDVEDKSLGLDFCFRPHWIRIQ